MPKRNPQTIKLIDDDTEPIEGKVYEPESVRVMEKEGLN